MRARIRALVKRWQTRLQLQHWRLRIKTGVFEDGGKFGELSAANASNPEYLEADLYFDHARIKHIGEDLNRLVCHELLHCHTAALVAVADEWAGADVGRKRYVHHLHEQLVSQLERILID